MINKKTKKQSLHAKNLITDMRAFEKEMIAAWHQAQGNDTFSLSDTVLHAGIFAERLFKALYIRKFNRHPKKMTFMSILKTMSEKRIIDNTIDEYADSLRKGANKTRHDTPYYKIHYRDMARNKMIEILKWYIHYTNAKLRNLKMDIYVKANVESAGHTNMHYIKENVMNEEQVLDSLALNEIIDSIPENIDEVIGIPVYAGLLIDKSGSMYQEKQRVIEGHNRAIRALKSSHVCENNLLYIFQQTFHHEVHTINPLRKLHHRGEDEVQSLNETLYNPVNGYGMTYLYDALFQHIDLLTREALRLFSKKSQKPQITIGVMTDGNDNTSQKHTANDVKKLLTNLRKQKMLKSAVIIGWNSSAFTEKHLQQLKMSIGFDEYIAIDIAEPRAIRNAFDLWSQINI